jgi:hypothetical protein
VTRSLLLLTIAIAALAQFACGLGRDRLTFSVKVSDVRREGNSLLKNKRPDETVEITLPGRLQRPPAPVNQVRRNEADRSTREHAVQSIVSANVAGDASWMVENFVSAEREQTSRQFADPALVQRTRDYYRNLGKVSITGWAEVRGLTVMFLQGQDEDGDASVASLALEKTPTGWKQTNALSQDDTFDLIWAALHTGGVH